MKITTTRAVAFAALAVGASTFGVLAGDLDPPAGPIEPTMKPLDEVEPRIAINIENTPGDANSLFRIATPGSYYLTANLGGVAGKSGIEIAAEDVTIDLGGFTLEGIPGTLDGIVDAAGGAVIVRHGTVRQFAGDGVDLGGAHSLAEDLVLQGNGGAGLRIGPSSTVVDCRAAANASDDFQAGEDVQFDRCISVDAGARGFDVGDGCTLKSCTATTSAHIGIGAGAACVIESCIVRQCNAGTDPVSTVGGITAGDGSIIRACTVTDTLTASGIYLPGSGIVDQCHASGNAKIGIWCTNISTVSALSITNCTARDNGTLGFAVKGGTVEGCAAQENGHEGIELLGAGDMAINCRATGNGDSGILVDGIGCVVRGCTANQNGELGIIGTETFGAGLLVVDCVANGNVHSGIQVTEGSSVYGCIARGNQNSGIAGGNGSRVEKCDCSNNQQAGIFILSGSSAINNTCTNNNLSNQAPYANISAGFGSGGCVVRGNTVSGGTDGIRAFTAGTLVVGNSVFGCTVPYNLSVAAYGPIIDVSAGGDISLIAGSDHPDANFIH